MKLMNVQASQIKLTELKLLARILAMKRYELAFKTFLILWMLLNASIYFLVLLPPEGKLASFMPEIVFQARAFIYPWFSNVANVS